MTTTTHGTRPDHHARTQSRTGRTGVPHPGYFEVPLRLIDPEPDVPRDVDDAAVDHLPRGLADHEQLQPIVVRPSPTPGRYLIVRGRRRWLAALREGRAFVTARLLDLSPDALDGAGLRLLQLAEGLDRQPLNPVTQARAFQSVMDATGWSRRQLADALGIGLAVVARACNMLSLPAELLDDIAAGKVALSPNEANHPRDAAGSPNEATGAGAIKSPNAANRPCGTLSPNEANPLRAAVGSPNEAKLVRRGGSPNEANAPRPAISPNEANRLSEVAARNEPNRPRRAGSPNEANRRLEVLAPNEANRRHDAVSSPNEANAHFVTTRVFHSPFGRLTIELTAPGGFVEMAGAIEAAARELCHERRARAETRPTGSP